MRKISPCLWFDHQAEEAATFYVSVFKNSKITAGKRWAPSAGARNPREYRVYRWNPDDGKNPRMDTYFVDLETGRQRLFAMRPALRRDKRPSGST